MTSQSSKLARQRARYLDEEAADKIHDQSMSANCFQCFLPVRDQPYRFHHSGHMFEHQDCSKATANLLILLTERVRELEEALERAGCACGPSK